jgi:SAM-dependent methyltransferase
MGDNQLAGDRLELLSGVFGESTSALLRAATPARTRVAADLGCGPGFSTSTMAEVTGAARTIGLDSSPSFIARARRDRDPALEFVEHDITDVPLPVGRPDLMFGRFVLAHLTDPGRVVGDWCTQLSPGGRLASDETEHIDTGVETFERYEEVARSMIAHYGANLYAGAVTRDLPPPSGTRMILSRLTDVRPPTADVARLFSMNLATWRHDPFVERQVPHREIERIAGGLEELQHSDATDELVFRNRQVVFERHT